MMPLKMEKAMINRTLEEKVDKILEILKFDSELWKCTYESEHLDEVKETLSDFKITLEDVDSSLDSIRDSIIDVEQTLQEVNDNIETLEDKK
jgi:predicted  nucleic acid-binding Zn-ribbon protein